VFESILHEKWPSYPGVGGGGTSNGSWSGRITCLPPLPRLPMHAMLLDYGLR
jgi:hypothetical protein